MVVGRSSSVVDGLFIVGRFDGDVVDSSVGSGVGDGVGSFVGSCVVGPFVSEGVGSRVGSSSSVRGVMPVQVMLNFDSTVGSIIRGVQRSMTDADTIPRWESGFMILMGEREGGSGRVCVFAACARCFMEPSCDYLSKCIILARISYIGGRARRCIVCRLWSWTQCISLGGA